MSLLRQEEKYLQCQGYPAGGYGAAPGTNQYPPPQPASPAVTNCNPTSATPNKNYFGIAETYILAIPFGFLGAHHFYLHRIGFGVLYFFTFGLLGVGWVADWFRVPCLVKEANAKREDPGSVPRKSLVDAYILWFPFGLFGVHNFYLKRPIWGIFYLFTLGGFGIGWLIDAFLIPSYVRAANATPAQPCTPGLKKHAEAYVLTLIPFTGLLGMQHYYLGRWGFGVLYTCTLGVFGVGWLVDLCRVPCLVNDINKDLMEGRRSRCKRLDDAYLCWFPPFGLLGFHHFVLNRPGWGVLYMFTLGCLGIGWIIDFFRMPCLVRQYNEKVETTDILQGPTYIIPGHQSGSPHGPGYQPGAPQGPGYQPGNMYPPLPPPHIQGSNYQPGFANPGYGSTGFSSWTTVGSNDPQSLTAGEQPPSYNEALSQSGTTLEQGAGVTGHLQAGAPGQVQADAVSVHPDLTKTPPPAPPGQGPSAPRL